jgi:triosephosphate isomerase
MIELPAKFVGVSLKMYFDHAQTLAWARQIADVVAARSGQLDDVALVVFPIFPSLEAVGEIFADLPVALGAQNLSAFESGAYTGEVPAQALSQLGCRYVEIGHAERRQLFGEDDTQITDKLTTAFGHQLVPLLCVGELEQGDPAAAGEYCVGQIERTLGQVAAPGPVIIAYEPIWAIGASTPAGPEHITAVAGAIRGWLDEQLPGCPARVVYGGSAGKGLFGKLGNDVDGLFLGRFAHDPGCFAATLGEVLDA